MGRTTMDIEVKGGTLNMTPIRASDQDGLREDSYVREAWVEAEVKVTGNVKVRGIDYQVSVDYRWLRSPRIVYKPRGVATDERTHWQLDYRWGDGYTRVDSGKKVDSGTATDKAIDAMVEGALEAFNAAEPDWRRESFRLRLEAMIASEASKAFDLRARADKHDAEATRLRTELEALGGDS